MRQQKYACAMKKVLSMQRVKLVQQAHETLVSIPHGGAGNAVVSLCAYSLTSAVSTRLQNMETNINDKGQDLKLYSFPHSLSQHAYAISRSSTFVRTDSFMLFLEDFLCVGKSKIPGGSYSNIKGATIIMNITRPFCIV